MAIQNLFPSGLMVPTPVITSGASTGAVIDAADEKTGSVNRAIRTGTITQVILGFGLVTTGATLDVRVETVDATTGHPTGTLVNAGSNASLVVANADDNTSKTVTFTTPASVTEGDVIAIFISNPGASFGNMNLLASAERPGTMGFPYQVQYASAAWTDATRNLSIVAVYDDGSKQNFGGNSATNILATSVNTGTTPDEIGNVFTLSVPLTCCGLWLDTQSSFTGNFELVLYDSSNTVLKSVSVDSDQRGNAASAYYKGYTADVSLAAGTYRIVAKPTTATNITVVEVVHASNNDLAVLDLGATCYKTVRTDAGAWTDTTTRRIQIGILVKGVDDGASSGSSLYTRSVQMVGL
jgi:hypothetical protein